MAREVFKDWHILSPDFREGWPQNIGKVVDKLQVGGWTDTNVFTVGSALVAINTASVLTRHTQWIANFHLENNANVQILKRFLDMEKRVLASILTEAKRRGGNKIEIADEMASAGNPEAIDILLLGDNELPPQAVAAVKFYAFLNRALMRTPTYGLSDHLVYSDIICAGIAMGRLIANYPDVQKLLAQLPERPRA